jgi:hypothetical protein
MNFRRHGKSKDRDAKERDVDQLFAEGRRTLGHLPKKFPKRQILGFPKPAVLSILVKSFKNVPMLLCIG